MRRQLAWIVDVDGTLALSPHRNPYDWRSGDKDLPNVAVVTVVQSLAANPDISAIIAVTGRQEQARTLTTEWLAAQLIPHDELLMRADGDIRPDDVVKQEMYRTQIEPRYQVSGVIDDRDRVVKMWRSLGLVCFQVADGAF